MADSPRWTMEHLHRHLQYAVDLELWTIPYYMSAMYSIQDRSSEAYQLIQTVVHQEMLHIQLASNVANAFGLSPRFGAPVYEGTRVPHLDFALNTPSPVPRYQPYSARIGPLDLPRINGMCLIEYPEWKSTTAPDLKDDVREYPNIAAFYDALEYGAGELAAHIRGGVNQVSYFERFYSEFPVQVVAHDGQAGLAQVRTLMDAIRDQGEGASDSVIETPFQNTADDACPDESHFAKFTTIQQMFAGAGGTPVQTYPIKPPDQLTDEDRAVAALLVRNFTELRHRMEHLFSGRAGRDDFFPVMVTVGANILNCWRHGIVPSFS